MQKNVLDIDSNFSNLKIDSYKNSCKLNNVSCYEKVMEDAEQALEEAANSFADYKIQAAETLKKIETAKENEKALKNADNTTSPTGGGPSLYGNNEEVCLN